MLPLMKGMKPNAASSYSSVQGDSVQAGLPFLTATEPPVFLPPLAAPFLDGHVGKLISELDSQLRPPSPQINRPG
jgi:hypothetical protein